LSIYSVQKNVLGFNVDGLFAFNGNGKYSPPEFTWSHSVGPSALKFLDSDKLGKLYKNDMFVGDFNDGNIYHFELNEKRTAISLEGPTC
jgi:aldose sugar dehydrogenase